MMLILAVIGFFALVIFFGLYFPRFASIGCGIYLFFKLGIAGVLEKDIGGHGGLTMLIVALFFCALFIGALMLDILKIRANPFK